MYKMNARDVYIESSSGDPFIMSTIVQAKHDNGTSTNTITFNKIAALRLI